MANRLVPVYLLNSSFQVQAVFDDYESAFFSRSLYNPGKFEIRINYNKSNVSLFARDLFVLFAGDNRRLGVITAVKKNLGKSGKIAQVVTVSGYELRSVFERRIVVPPVGYEAYTATGPAETVFKNFLSNQCIGSGTAARNFTFLTLAADSARGSSCEISARLKNVGATLWDLATMVDMGISITAPTSGSVATVDVIPGVDRRSSQSTNPRAIFSVTTDTAGNATISDSDAKYKTLVYAAGQGVGTARNILTVYSGTEPTGLARREMYLDARDLESNTDITTRANNKLAEYGQTVTLDAEALQYSALQLGTDYDLGDLCTCEALGVTSDVRITEVQESWANNKYDINLTFGKPVANIANQVATIYNTNQTINNFSEFGQNAAESLITTNAPKYLGRYLASNPATYNNGDSWVVYDTDDSPIQRGLWYSNNGTPTRITTSSSMELQGKFIAALGDIAWAEENGYGVASDYGFSAIFQSLGVVTAFVNSLFAQYIKVQTGGSIRGGDRYDETGATVDGTKPGFFIAASGACKVAGIEFEGSLGGGVQWSWPSQIGSTLTLSGVSVPSIAALNGTEVAFVDDGNSQLRTYRWSGNSWAQVGTGLNITSVFFPTITALNGTDIAFADANSRLGVYRWSGSAWSLVGSILSVTLSVPGITSLNGTDVALVSDTWLRVYRWSGSAWSQVGSSFTVSASSIGIPAIAALNATDVALISDDDPRLRVYRWSGSAWSQVGSGLTISGGGVFRIAAFNGTDIALIDSVNDQLRIYRWSGSAWSQVNDAGNTGITGTNAPSLAALNGTDVAFVEGPTGQMRVYRFSFSVSTPYSRSLTG